MRKCLFKHLQPCLGQQISTDYPHLFEKLKLIPSKNAMERFGFHQNFENAQQDLFSLVFIGNYCYL